MMRWLTYVFVAYACAIRASDTLRVTLSVTPMHCTPGSAVLKIHGGLQPYTIAWSSGNSNSLVDYAVNGTYTVQVTDAAGRDTMLSYDILLEPCEVVIGNHFNNWSGNAFNPAAEQFMTESCTKPGVVCTTYQNVLAWMAAQDPGVLQPLLDSPATFN